MKLHKITMMVYIYLRKVFRDSAVLYNNMTLQCYGLLQSTGRLSEPGTPCEVPQVPGQSSVSPFAMASRIAAFSVSSSIDGPGQYSLSAPTQSSKKPL